jgi:hypothetical protein
VITTKYNFKQWFRKKYPDIILIPIYGTAAYIFDKELDPIDMYEYNVQQLANGQYVVFIGIKDTQYIQATIKQLNVGPLHQSKRPLSEYAPTTFSSFEHWLSMKGIEYIHRTHLQDQSANEALFTNNENWNTKRNWYMYELPADIQLNPQTPYIKTENGTIVALIKCSTSAYVSKKKLFMQKFALMQPLYEQLIAACATEDWEQAKNLCEQYASIQFEFEAVIKNIEDMKEAYANGTLRLYTREVANFEVAQDDEAL